MRRVVGIAAAALAVGILVGCSGPDTGSSGSDAGAGEQTAAPQSAGPANPASPSLPAGTARQVVTTATASVAVKDPAAGAQRISELVESAGGRVDKRTEHAGAGKDRVEGASADLVVRVPAAKLTGVLADLKDLGDVENVSVDRSDVTAQAVDLDARISALQTSVARLQGLMDKAATTDALLAAEKALSDRQAQLESLQSQRALLGDQVELSTLEVHLEPFGVAPAGGPKSFASGLGTGWRALVAALHAAAIALGVLLPWLVLAALVAAAVLIPLRRARRRPAAAVSMPPLPPAPPQG